MRQKDILQPDLITLADFFTSLGTVGRKSRTIKTAKCVLKHIFPNDKVTLLSEPIIENIIQGIGKKNISIPKKVNTWDIQVVVHHLASMPHYKKLSLMQLSCKTLMLILITTMRRQCEVHRLSFTKMMMSAYQYTFMIESPYKNYSDNYNMCQEFNIARYPQHPEKCSYTAVTFYL